MNVFLKILSFDLDVSEIKSSKRRKKEKGVETGNCSRSEFLAFRFDMSASVVLSTPWPPAPKDCLIVVVCAWFFAPERCERDLDIPCTPLQYTSVSSLYGTQKSGVSPAHKYS